MTPNETPFSTEDAEREAQSAARGARSAQHFAEQGLAFDDSRSALIEDSPPVAREGGESEEDPRLTKALEECLAALESGQALDRAQLRARYPDVADELSEHLEGLEFLHLTA